MKHLLFALGFLLASHLLAATIGKTAVGGSSSAFSANFLIANGPYTAAANGTVTSVSLYTGAAGINFYLAVYADSSGTPGALIGASAQQTSVLNNWVTASVSGSLTSGAVYWIAAIAAADLAVVYDADSTVLKYRALTYTTPPNPFGGSPSSATNGYSMYATYTPALVDYAVNDARIYFPPGGWEPNGATWKQTVCNGNNFSFVVNGACSGVFVDVDVSTLSGGGVSSGNYPKVGWIVDGVRYALTQLVSGQTAITLPAAVGSGAHTYFVYQAADKADTYDKYVTPVNCLRITGVSLSADVLGTYTPFPKVVLIAGDSIACGYYSLGVLNQILGTDAIQAFPLLLRTELSAEISVQAHSGQGYCRAAPDGTPAYFTPGDDAASAWNKYRSGVSRTWTGITEIWLILGENDEIFSSSDAAVQASVAGVLPALTSAAPSARLRVFTPLSGYKSAPIQAGALGYYFYNVGAEIRSQLLDTAGGASATLYSVDQIHPGDVGHSVAAALYLKAVSTGGLVVLSGLHLP